MTHVVFSPLILACDFGLLFLLRSPAQRERRSCPPPERQRRHLASSRRATQGVTASRSRIGTPTYWVLSPAAVCDLFAPRTLFIGTPNVSARSCPVAFRRSGIASDRGHGCHDHAQSPRRVQRDQ